jgi:hypothetical protein
LVPDLLSILTVRSVVKIAGVKKQISGDQPSSETGTG